MVVYLMKANVGRETIYLYLVQISNIILPLVLVPYLAHVLGVEFFGKLSYAQAISYIAIFFVDFGFNFSAARNIGIDTNNNKNISRIYSNVQVIKSLIFTAVVLLGIAFVLLSNQSIIDKKLTILGVLSASSSILMPAWLFQGLGRNSNVAFLNFASRLLSLLLIVLFVKNQEDLIIAAICQLFSPVLAGVGMQMIMLKNKVVDFTFSHISFEDIKILSRDSFHNFSASFLTLGFTYFNPIIIKVFLGDSVLGVYSFADKLANVLRQLYIPLVQANFSRVCSLFHEQKYSTLKNMFIKITYVFLGISLFAYISNYFLGEVVINLFFSEGEGVSTLLRVMIFTQFIIAISMILVNLIVIPAGQSYYLKKVYLFAVIFYFSIIYPMIKWGGVYGVAISISLVELLIVCLFFKFIKKKKILI